MEELIVSLIALGAITVFFAGMWKTFEKAGLKGWKSLIPLYNIYLVIKISELPVWILLLIFIPFVSAVVSIIIYYNFAKKFGKSGLFSILCGLFPFIAVPIIGFDSSRYEGNYRP